MVRAVMKFMLLGMMICSVQILAAQSINSYPAPDSKNEPYYFNKNGHSLEALEKASAQMEQLTKALGYMGTATEFVISGEKSPVIIQPIDSMEFIIGSEGMLAEMDPSQILALYSLKIYHHNREAALQETKGIFKKKHEESRLPYEVKKIGDTIVLILPKRLSKGEYAFINLAATATNQSLDAYCFRVQ
jgi:hypothetical protein